MRKATQQGFTLIELLIVIGLLGALTALVLPSLSADREEALGSVCDYNQAGTVRTLKQYSNVFGLYPNQFHTGLTAETVTDSTANGTVMDGIPSAQNANLGHLAPANYIINLSPDQVGSLSAAGITDFAYGDGYNIVSVNGTAPVLSIYDGTNTWKDDSDPADDYTFDGATVADWEAGTGPDGRAGEVICLWITPTLDWSVNQESANKDWTGGNLEMEISLEGQCPIPAEGISGDPEFAYYMAYFKVYSDGTAAKLIGTSCPECGIMNP